MNFHFIQVMKPRPAVRNKVRAIWKPRVICDMFPQILCDVAHYQQISIICQPPGKLRSREMLSEKRASEGANDERYGINISCAELCGCTDQTMKSPQIPALSITIISISGWQLQAAELIPRLAEHTLCCALSKKHGIFISEHLHLRSSSPNNWIFYSCSVEHKSGRILILAIFISITTRDSNFQSL